MKRVLITNDFYGRKKAAVFTAEMNGMYATLQSWIDPDRKIKYVFADDDTLEAFKRGVEKAKKLLTPPPN